MARFTVIRHANPEPAQENDAARNITKKGYEQAARRGETLKGEVFDLVLASMTVRAMETARIIQPNHAIVVLPELYETTGPAQERFNVLFAELGRVPLSEYLKRDPEAIHHLGLVGYEAIRAHVLLLSRRNVLVVGHAVVMQYVFRTITHSDYLLTMNPGETEGFIVEENGDVIPYP